MEWNTVKLVRKLLGENGISVRVHLLGRFSLICFVTRARVEISSTIIFTTISVIAPVDGIVG